MEEIKRVVMGKRVIVSNDESKLIAQIGIFGLSQFYFHNLGDTGNKFEMYFSSKSSICSKGRLWRRNEACGYREIWDWIWRLTKIIRTIRIFGLSEFWGENKIERLSDCTLLNKVQSSDWDVNGKIRLPVTEIWDWIRKWIKLVTTFGLFGQSKG